MIKAFQITPYRASLAQELRNVSILSPTIIQIISGSKQMFFKEKTAELTSSTLLLSHATTSLSFINLPHKGPFYSRAFSFNVQASDEMIKLSEQQHNNNQLSVVIATPAINQTLDLLANLHLTEMSSDTQAYWVQPLYQQLAEMGALHKLFPNRNAPLTQRIAQYIAVSPSEEHKLEETAHQFAMSRATLIRKLKDENTRYRELLADIRMNHALQLMQTMHINQLQLAQMCGYQSEERFSQRFKNKFGLSPKDYQKTINAK